MRLRLVYQLRAAIGDKLKLGESKSYQQDMVRAIDACGIKPIVDKIFPLEDIVAAFKYQESNKHFGKICLEM